jgi:deoxyribodipyrimidine photo-lyase
MTDSINIVWFRQDLRLADNPALVAAAAQGEVLPVYILDDESAGAWAMGGASRWWLHHSLVSLDESMAGNLVVLRGRAADVLPDLVRETGAQGVSWNRCYEPWRIQQDKETERELAALPCRCENFEGGLLWDPRRVLKADETPYKVFTPFYRKCCRDHAEPRVPLAVPPLTFSRHRIRRRLTVDDLQLLSPLNWQDKLASHWCIGEKGAQARLNDFMAQGVDDYQVQRDYPARENISRLSPHLHFGEISPGQVWHAASPGDSDFSNREHFRRELGWREFSYHLLFHFPEMPEENLKPRFDRFPWLGEGAGLSAWQRGETGIPLVDAGMRELWQTGFMHNRVRMITGSFLVKNLLLDWRLGAQWFWDCLVDADLASNSAGWQWVAGSGADAAPYFRIFNPVTQGKRFDSAGEYVRRYLPELAHLPDRYVHCPWDAPAAVLSAAGVELGKNYPHPIVSLKVSRERALEALGTLR